MSSANVERIRELNDQFRTLRNPALGEIVLTEGVASKGNVCVARCLLAVCTYDAFTRDNDPYEEHDFGAFEIDGQRYFWKIDYYNSDLTGGSERPDDVNITNRILTIFHSSEY